MKGNATLLALCGLLTLAAPCAGQTLAACNADAPDGRWGDWTPLLPSHNHYGRQRFALKAWPGDAKVQGEVRYHGEDGKPVTQPFHEELVIQTGGRLRGADAAVEVRFKGLERRALVYVAARVTPIAVKPSLSPLETAKRLAHTRFKGWTYGGDPAQEQVDCVQFVLAVVEEHTHQTLRAEVRNRILINDVSVHELKKDGYAIVVANDRRIRGVSAALVDGNLGTEVDPAAAKPGDLIQYWMQRADGTWMGHAGILESVESRNGEIRATIFGAHRSTNGIGVSSFKLKLTPDAKRRVYLVRLR